VSPDIFIDDFEITENTEELQAILGRSLIIATRFDNSCDHVAKFLNLKMSCATILPSDKFDEYVNELFSKFSTLNNNINVLPIGQPEKNILHKARVARNVVAHSLTVGMTGCLDIKIDEQGFKTHVSDLVLEISAGDFLISTILSILNKDPLPKYSESHYKKRIVDWVQGT
jgi:hypothetical protein